MWFILAILGAFFQATFLILNKYFLKRRISEYILGAGVFLTSAIILFILAIIRGIPDLGPAFLYAAIATGLLNVIATILILKSLKITDASLVIPMLSFTPAFLILTSFLILGEVPTRTGILGILLIVVGSYALNFKSLKIKEILFPFRKLFSTRGLIYMFIVAFIFGISTNYDKLAIVNSDPIFGSAVICFFIAIPLIIISVAKKQNFLKEYKTNFFKFGLVAIVSSLSIIAINTALTLQIVPYVISIKRTSILLGVIYGFLLFKEKNVGKRLFGALIMFAGMALIILGS